MKRKPTSDALEIIDRLVYEGRPRRQQQLAEMETNDEIGRKVFELRTKVGLTQAKLAKMIGTTPSVICRLEDADYEGHSLSMLRRIAAALNRKVEIRFVALRRPA